MLPTTTTSGTTPVTTSAPAVTQQTAPSSGQVLSGSNTSPATSPSGPSGGGVAPTEFASTQRATQQGRSTQGGQLPFTGGDVPLIVLLGGAALSGGALLLRRSRSGAR